MLRVRISAAVLLLISLFSFSSCSGFGINRVMIYENADRYTAVSSGEVEANISKIEIEWICGDVSVKVGTEESISFTEQGYNPDNDSDVESFMMHYLLDGNTLRIKYCRSGASAVNPPEKSLVVAIPEGVALAEISISSVSADVDMRGIRVSDLEIETVSGDVGITELAATEAEFESVSGNVIISGNVTRLELNTVSGNANLDVSCPDRLSAESVSGNIALRLPPASGFVMEYGTVSGNLNCGFSAEKSGDEYTVGDGSARFEVETVSGDVTVTPVN